MMDQLGTNGLTGEVDQHYWRLFGAIFIGGATRWAADAANGNGASWGAGQIATGLRVGQSGGLATHRAALDTRPTIKVFSGQPCQVLLLKPLALPAVWQ